MPLEKPSRIASLGGRKAQALGTAHRFSHEEAVRAGKKSRQLHNRNRRALHRAD